MLTPASLGKAAVAFVIGLAAGIVGTLAHRSVPPWGLLLALALVLCSLIALRAWGGWPCLVGAAGGLFLSVQALAQTGPGGDVLVPPGAVGWLWLGWTWVFGSLALVAVAALLPRRWFSDEPRPSRRRPAEPPTTSASEPEVLLAPDEP